MTRLLHSALSLAVVTSVHVAKSMFCLSSAGTQVRVTLGFCWCSKRNTCPIQRHLRHLFCLLMVQALDCRFTSSFVTLIGQYIFNNLRRHFCINVSSFATSLLVILDVLLLKSITVMTLDLKILISVVFAQLTNSPYLNQFVKCSCNFS